MSPHRRTTNDSAESFKGTGRTYGLKLAAKDAHGWAPCVSSALQDRRTGEQSRAHVLLYPTYAKCSKPVPRAVCVAI